MSLQPVSLPAFLQLCCLFKSTSYSHLFLYVYIPYYFPSRLSPVCCCFTLTLLHLFSFLSYLILFPTLHWFSPHIHAIHRLLLVHPHSPHPNYSLWPFKYTHTLPPTPSNLQPLIYLSLGINFYPLIIQSSTTEPLPSSTTLCLSCPCPEQLLFAFISA